MPLSEFQFSINGNFINLRKSDDELIKPLKLKIARILKKDLRPRDELKVYVLSKDDLF